MPKRQIDITFRMEVETGDADITDMDVFSALIENQVMAPLRIEMGEDGFERFSQRALRVLVYAPGVVAPALQERNNTGVVH
jgi:hypothetical protein